MTVKELLDNICVAYYIVIIRKTDGEWIDCGSKEELDKEWMDINVRTFKYFAEPNNLYIIAEHERD